MALRSWVCYFNLKGDEQVELLAGLVIPEFARPNAGPLMKQSHVLVIARVGNDHAPFQCQDGYLMAFLQTIISMVVVGERGTHVLRWLVKSFIAFLGESGLTRCVVLLHLRPQRLVRGSH